LGLDDNTPIDAKILSNQIESAQKRIEEQNFKRRKYVLTYDDVMNQQRNLIYKQRNDVLCGEDVSDTIRKMITDTVSEALSTYMQGDDALHWDLSGLREHYRGLLTSDDDFNYTEKELSSLKYADIEDLLCDRAMALYEEKATLLGEERFGEIQKAVLLQNVDRAWMEHIDAMDDLKDTIRLQSFAQRDPVTEYRIRGAEMFDAVIEEIRKIKSVLDQE
jgi:preprotein translocase subunit SecA